MKNTEIDPTRDIGQPWKLDETCPWIILDRDGDPVSSCPSWMSIPIASVLNGRIIEAVNEIEGLRAKVLLADKLAGAVVIYDGHEEHCKWGNTERDEDCNCGFINVEFALNRYQEA